ncbi:MAG: AAA family ATPase [Methyloligellaceae bacterium]
MIIFVGGLIGAGKSTVAKSLATKYGLFYYDVDEVKKVVYQQDPDYEKNLQNAIPFCDETRKKLYDRVVDDIKAFSNSYECLIVDETLHKREMRHQLFDAAEKYFGNFIVIWVKADEEVIKERLTSKVRKNHILKDPMSMHNAMLAEFETFEQPVIVCRNNIKIEETMKDVDRVLSAIIQFGKITQTGK